MNRNSSMSSPKRDLEPSIQKQIIKFKETEKIKPNEKEDIKSFDNLIFVLNLLSGGKFKDDLQKLKPRGKIFFIVRDSYLKYGKFILAHKESFGFTEDDLNKIKDDLVPLSKSTDDNAFCTTYYWLFNKCSREDILPEFKKITTNIKKVNTDFLTNVKEIPKKTEIKSIGKLKIPENYLKIGQVKTPILGKNQISDTLTELQEKQNKIKVESVRVFHNMIIQKVSKEKEENKKEKRKKRIDDYRMKKKNI